MKKRITLTPEITKRLRQARIEKNITIQEAASVLKRTIGTITHIERNQTRTSVHLPALAKAYGVSQEWLLTGQGQKDILFNEGFEEKDRIISRLNTQILFLTERIKLLEDQIYRANL